MPTKGTLPSVISTSRDYFSLAGFEVAIIGRFWVATEAFEEAPASSPQATILIADDFGDWRARVRRILSGQPEWQIVGEACDGVEAVQKAAELRPDIVLLDVGMPALNGIQAAEKTRQTTPDSKIVFLTQDNDTELRRAALSTGAEGYVAKTSAVTELFPAVAAALRNSGVSAV